MRTWEHRKRVQVRASVLLSLGMALCGCGIIDGFGYALGTKDKCPAVGNAEPPIPIGELHDGWALRFGPFKQGEPWTWNVVPTEDMRRICGGAPPDIFGCTDYRGGCPTTYVTQANATDRLLAAHEYAHTVLFWTLGLGHTDRDHLRPDIWSTGGFVHSVSGQ